MRPIWIWGCTTFSHSSQPCCISLIIGAAQGNKSVISVECVGIVLWIVHAVLDMDVGFGFTNNQCFCMWHCIWRLAKCVYALFIWCGYWRLCMCLFIQAIACGSNLTFIYGALGLWVSNLNRYSMRCLGWNAVHVFPSCHQEGFHKKNIGYNVFTEKNLIAAGFYRWIGYSIKCK